jgi:hypothetical protein
MALSFIVANINGTNPNQQARESTGRLWVVYSDLGTAAIGLAYSDDNGATWATEAVPAATATWFSICIDSSDTLHICWPGGAPSGVQYRTRSVVGVYSAVEQVVLHGIGDSQWSVSIAMDSADIPHIAWIFSDAAAAFYIRHSSRAGGAWAAADVIQDTAANVHLNRLILRIDNASQPHLVWDEDDWNTGISTLLHSHDVGAGWIAPEPIISGLGFVVTSFGFVFDGATVQVVYTADTAGGWANRETYFIERVAGWGVPVPLTGAPDNFLPVITRDLAGTIYSFWRNNIVPDGVIRKRQGGVWQAPAHYTHGVLSMLYSVYPKTGGVSTNILNSGFGGVASVGSDLYWYKSDRTGCSGGNSSKLLAIKAI